MAAGCLIYMVYAVVKRILRNGFAIIRPPGHHAEIDKAMGFCFFNNVAVAARLAQRKLGVKRVLIVDWDVHHGNGTQDIFKDDPSVLYISLHRYDNGKFYPGGDEPAATSVGIGAGEGTSVNIPWNGVQSAPPGDIEYLSAFIHIINPIAREFAPDLVMVSAGFDCAVGDMGGCNVTTEVRIYITHRHINKVKHTKYIHFFKHMAYATYNI